MLDDNTTRRKILRRAGAIGTGVIAASGTVAACGASRRIVGTSSCHATEEARDRAKSVQHLLDFNEMGEAVVGHFSDKAAKKLRQHCDVRYVEDDITVHAIRAAKKQSHNNGNGNDDVTTASQTLPWGIDRVDAEVAHANGETGNGADIAIIDTGIDDDHPDLRANVGSGKAYVNCRGSNCNYPWSDDNNHGTHCAGTSDAVDNSEGVVGVSTTATLHAVKVLDNYGSGYLSDVAAGIKYTADQGWDVGSLSLGASSGGQTLKDACTYAYQNGVLLIAAAGNSGPCTDCVNYPAAYEECVAVSATSKDDSLAWFSSTGPEIELAAPGEAIYSTVISGYDTYSGTSMACPHVSGGGAQLMANGYTNTEARSRLKSTAENIGLGDTESGSGLLDVAAALGLDSSDN